MLKKASLQHILVLQFILVSIVPLLALFFLGSYFATSHLEEAAERQVQYLGHKVSRDVNEFMVGVRRDMQAVAAALNAYGDWRNLDHQYFDELVTVYPYLATISVFDENLRVVKVGLRPANQSRREDFVGLDMSHQHEEFGFFDSDMGWSRPHFSVFSGALEVDYMLPLDKGFLNGMLTLQYLQQLRETLMLDENDQFALIDGEGMLVVHSDLNIHQQYQGQRFTNCSLDRAGLVHDKSGLQECSEDTGLFEAVYKIPSTGWLVWVGRPIEDALSTLTRLQAILLPLLLTALVFALAGAWYTWRLIAAPIERLVEINRSLPEGDFSALENFEAIDSFKELDVLSESQREMARALADREDRLLAREKALQEMVAELYSLFDGLPDSLVWFDNQRRVRWANWAAATTLAKERQQLFGVTCEQLECQSREACSVCPVTRVFETGQASDGLVKAGTRIFGVKAFPIHDVGTGHGVVRLLSDITDKFRLRQETLRNHRLVSLGELSAGIAHEINNPIGMILWNLPILEAVLRDAFEAIEQVPESQELVLGNFSYAEVQEMMPEILKDIDSGARRIKAIVDDLKEFVRPDEAQDNQLVDLNQVVEKALRMTRSRIQEATHRFEKKLNSEPLWVYADPLRIEQVFVNLLMNACDALESAEDQITVVTRHDPSVTQHLVEVRDRGRGIPEEDLDRAIDPFFTTRRTEGGTGLGLSISSRIVQQYNGSLKFESKVGEGTTVRVEFPAVSVMEGGNE